jgi:hypothetical protein
LIAPGSITTTSIPKPLTNSVWYSLYKHLPNGTDFRLFKTAGYQGFNFAFIGHVAKYPGIFGVAQHRSNGLGRSVRLQEIFWSVNSRKFRIGWLRIRELQATSAARHNVEGGEPVCLTIQAVASQDLFSPIIGFYVKDRLGQNLFGENTYGTSVSAAPMLRTGTTVEARFCFAMPRLPMGDYSVCAAIAEGTQQLHVQHHWVHDALFFKSLCTSASSGLVGIPVTAELVLP